MPNNNLLSLIMDPEDKQIQSFTNASWVCNTLKPSIEKISRGEFPSYFTNPPKIFSEKKRGSKICVYKKKSGKFAATTNSPEISFFPTIFPKNPFTKKLVICYHPRHLQSASSKSGSWSIHPARPQASTQTHHQHLAPCEGGFGGATLNGPQVHSTDKCV